ncbi:MAG: hypothetical protein HYV02_07480 [Deltaproteobacteria bacterium]|nr:hypothetical protein [Deltaproteobacteria bacterium]
MTGCSAEPAPPPAAVAEGFVIGDGIQITPDLQTDAANSTAVPLQEGMARLEAAGGLDDPQQVHDTVLGMFKGVEAAETGLVVAYVLLNHFAFADGHSADDKAAWGATVAEGMQLALLHTGETLKAIAREVRVDLAYPEVTKTIPLSDGRQFLCQNMPERLGEHLVRIQGENAEAMVLHARHVRRLLDQGFGETDEERAILMTRLLASKSLIRGDLCELMDRYRSPDYEATLRASLENPLAQYMPNEPPGMLDLYQVAIRSVWQRFWDNFHLLSGYSGWGAFIGFMIAGSLLRRRRHRYERARRGALENVAGSQVQSAKEMLGMAAENGEDGDGGTQQSTDVVATQGNARATRGERRRVDTSPEGVQNAVNEMAKSVTLMGQLLHEEPPRFFSRARWRLRGESLAFYLPAVACLMLLGDGIESYQQMSERAAIPLLLPELRPVPAERIGLSYLQANDFEGYPQEVVALLDELAASMPKE